MQASASATAAAMTECMQLTRPGVQEYQLAALFGEPHYHHFCHHHYHCISITALCAVALCAPAPILGERGTLHLLQLPLTLPHD